jgi:hypothetical protein
MDDAAGEIGARACPAHPLEANERRGLDERIPLESRQALRNGRARTLGTGVRQRAQGHAANLWIAIVETLDERSERSWIATPIERTSGKEPRRDRRIVEERGDEAVVRGDPHTTKSNDRHRTSPEAGLRQRLQEVPSRGPPARAPERGHDIVVRAAEPCTELEEARGEAIGDRFAHRLVSLRDAAERECGFANDGPIRVVQEGVERSDEIRRGDPGGSPRRPSSNPVVGAREGFGQSTAAGVSSVFEGGDVRDSRLALACAGEHQRRGEERSRSPPSLEDVVPHGRRR